MQALAITWKRVIAVWWLIVWRTSVMGYLFWILISFVVTAAGQSLSIFEYEVLISNISFLATGALCAVVVRMALKKKYSDFRLALFPREITEGQKIQELEMTWKRVIAVWWLIVWRTSVVNYLLMIFATFALIAIGLSPQLALEYEAVVNIIVFVATAGWCLVVVRMALNKRYADFQLKPAPIQVS